MCLLSVQSPRNGASDSRLEARAGEIDSRTVYLIAARGNFWREFVRGESSEHAKISAVPLPSVLAVIPARDEAAVVGKAIASLADQRYSGRFHIVVVDDSSSDGTAQAARAAAPPALLTVVSARPLPPVGRASSGP